MTSRIIENPDIRERVFIFQDRLHAGRLLAEKLRKFKDQANAILLTIPAGGIPVGYEVSKELGITFDVIIVRKVQIPWNPEAGFGALTWDGEAVLNTQLIKHLGLNKEQIKISISKTSLNIQERLKKFRGDKNLPDLSGKVVILVDDGLASGYTMLAASRSVRKKKPEKIVVAVPTGSRNALELLSPEVDEIVCLNIRSGPAFAVADAYKNWYDLTDEEVTEILKKS